MKKEIGLINDELNFCRQLFVRVAKIVPEFNIADPKLLPYGLKPHTRSISWIAEQIITQQAKHNSQNLNINDVDIDLPDTALHDCIVHAAGKSYYVNVKIHNSEGKKNKNDISAVQKVYSQYNAKPDYRLIYVCFPVKFNNTLISIIGEGIHVFSPQFLPVYVNPRNDKIQAFYHHEPVMRSRKEFLSELVKASKSIIL